MTALIKDRDGTVVRDFAERTLKNLLFIENQLNNFLPDGENPEVYEVTQLVNSILGLLVFPKETFWDHLINISSEELPIQFTQKPQPKDFQDLIRLMRNGFSHFNLELRPQDNEIYAIHMFNLSISGIQTWEATITVEDLREFVIWFAKGIIDSSLLDMPVKEIKAV